METRPKFLEDKTMDPHIKGVMKKFPVIEQPKQGQTSPLFLSREQIQDQLAESYHTLVDVMGFHAAVMDVLANLSSQQIQFDVMLNGPLTQMFLDVVYKFICSMEMLSRFSDRKTIAGCYQCTYELLKGVGEPNYQALSQLLMAYEVPLKQLPLTLESHSKLISQAVLSLKPVFDVRHLPSSMLFKDSTFTISSNPSAMGTPPSVDKILADLVPVDSMVKWICVCFLVLPNELMTSPDAMDIFGRALTDGYMLPLFREHTLNIFKCLEVVLASPGGQKHKKQLKGFLDKATDVNTSAAQFHMSRRQYSRFILRQLHLLIADKPGLIGPKASVVLAALSMARAEILWLFRHRYAAEKLTAKKKMEQGMLEDSELAEL